MSLGIQWSMEFAAAIQSHEVAVALRNAAASSNLAEWTRLLTAAVVRSCTARKWQAAAKGYRSTVLPQAGQEYLGIDVMAFAEGAESSGRHWPLPLAIFELENLKERAAYSLWKVLCVRAALRVVFAYRNDWEQVRALVRTLKDEVIAGLSPQERLGAGEDLLLVTGSRGEGETFPYGYFKIWRLNPNTANFEKFPGWG